jgi:transcription elongation factor GreA
VKKEHAELTEKRVDAVKELSIARDMGDRSENGYYIAARRKLSSTDSRLRHLAMLLKNGQVVQHTFTGFIDIGCKVTISDGENTFEYTIVGGFESDIPHGKLSQNSPIGRSLLGKKEGDTITVNVPAGVKSYKVIKVTAE